jgi:hypothetical protein
MRRIYGNLEGSSETTEAIDGEVSWLVVSRDFYAITSSTVNFRDSRFAFDISDITLRRPQAPQRCSPLHCSTKAQVRAI